MAVQNFNRFSGQSLPWQHPGLLFHFILRSDCAAAPSPLPWVKYPGTECRARTILLVVLKTSANNGPSFLGRSNFADCWPQKLQCQAGSFGCFFQFKAHGLPKLASRKFEIRFGLQCSSNSMLKSNSRPGASPRSNAGPVSNLKSDADSRASCV